MRIIGISGSPRGIRSSTRKLLDNVLAGAKAAGAETELIDVSELQLDYCTACEVCHVVGKCTRKDDFEPIRQKLLDCDGIVLASPNYFNTVTAQLKTIIDRLSGEIHCQCYLGKYACSVATAGGPEYDLAVDYMNGVLTRWGCSVVGGVGASMAIPGSFDAGLESASELGAELAAAIRDRRAYPEQDAAHKAMFERFKFLIGANKEHWPYEYEYWKSRNWL